MMSKSFILCPCKYLSCDHSSFSGVCFRLTACLLNSGLFPTEFFLPFIVDYIQLNTNLNVTFIVIILTYLVCFLSLYFFQIIVKFFVVLQNKTYHLCFAACSLNLPQCFSLLPFFHF
jgi:hypothetical protein